MSPKTAPTDARSEATQKAHLAFLTAWFESVADGKTENDVVQWLGCTPEHLQELLLGRAKATLEELFLIADKLEAEPGAWVS